jgi:hypothetical protein
MGFRILRFLLGAGRCGRVVGAAALQGRCDKGERIKRHGGFGRYRDQCLGRLID